VYRMSVTKSTAAPSIPNPLKWNTMAAPIPAPKTKAIQIRHRRPIFGSARRMN
jgi:hypothetical protein